MDDFVLNEAEVRVLGALLEKDMATPEYYPLTLNALLNACNQKSNRDPVVAYDEATVLTAIDGLKAKRLVVRGDSGRVPRYAECFVGNAKLIAREAALLCLLLLRGPQTIGELRGRSDRLYAFADLGEVEETLQNLTEMDMVRKLPRQPGRKESRYAHLLAGEPDDSLSGSGSVGPGLAPAVAAGSDRLARLEEEVAVLQVELEELRREFAGFKGQFE